MKQGSKLFTRFFFSRLFLIVAFLSAGFVVAGFARGYYQDYKIKQEIESLQAELKGLEKRKLESMEILSYVLSDDFVEEKARTEFNMKKPNEHVVVVEENSPAPARSGEEFAAGHEISNPVKWWYYFRHKPLSE